MSDPLTRVIELLRPRTVASKLIEGAGAWTVRYAPFGGPSFCVVLEGACRLELDGQPERTLREGDFAFLPSTPGFAMSGLESACPVLVDPGLDAGSTEPLRHGTPDSVPDVRLLGGYFAFDAPASALLIPLLPALVLLRGIDRLATLVKLVREESLEARAGGDLVRNRLVEILLVEALRGGSGQEASPGLLRGLADARIAPALRGIHADPGHAWSLGELARIAAMSRSSFHERFVREVGIAPMGYLLGWRMAVARDLLRRRDLSQAEIAERVGYGSTSAFATAFRRQAGMSPGRYAREA